MISETASSKIPRLVRNQLASDDLLLKLFEGNIFAADYETLENPVAVPSLWVVPANSSLERQIGGTIEAVQNNLVMAFLPRQCPFLSSLQVPSAPTLAEDGSGILSGVYKYVLTVTTNDGESTVSSEASITVTTKQVEITFPIAVNNTGWNIYRSKAGFTSLHWLTWIPVNETSYTDNTPDSSLSDLLAPIPFYSQSIMDNIYRVLLANETLADNTMHNALPNMTFSPLADKILTQRNIRTKNLQVFVPYRFDPVTLEIEE